jgi:hypothetical protein
VTEQDTFSAHGKTLTGDPYRFNVDVRFDSDGNITGLFANGNAENVPLPGGGSFHTAGRIDFLAHPGDDFVLTPDQGNTGNLAGFCTALS